VLTQHMVSETFSKLVKVEAALQLAQQTSPLLLRASSSSSSLPAASVGISAVTGIVPMPDAMMKAVRMLLRQVLVREPLLNARGQHGQKRGGIGGNITFSHRPLLLAFDDILRAACGYEGSGIQFPPIAKTYSLPKGVSCSPGPAILWSMHFTETKSLRAHQQPNSWCLFTISSQRSLLNTQCKGVSICVVAHVSLFMCSYFFAAPIATGDGYVGATP
jgi:hypothetical protein